MTWQEFYNDWYSEHVACFPGIPAWMKKLEKSSDGPAARDVMKAWYSVLRDVELAAAKEASHKMHAGDIEEPKGFDRHPAAIRKACGLDRRKFDAGKPHYDSDGNQTYACLLCGDTGYVFCWHPKTIREVFATGSIGYRYTIAYVCRCAAGASHSAGNPPRYDARQCCRIDGVLNEKADATLLEWVANYKPVRSENHESALDAPSQQRML